MPPKNVKEIEIDPLFIQNLRNDFDMSNFILKTFPNAK